MQALEKRLAVFELEVEPTKTKLLRFGSNASRSCHRDGLRRPQTFNFPDVVAAFTDAGCLFVVAEAKGLAERIRQLLADASERERLGAAARGVVAQNVGASSRLLELLRAEIRARRSVSSD